MPIHIQTRRSQPWDDADKRAVAGGYQLQHIAGPDLIKTHGTKGGPYGVFKDGNLLARFDSPIARDKWLHQILPPETCAKCGGVGRILVRGPRRRRAGRTASIEICPACHPQVEETPYQPSKTMQAIDALAEELHRECGGLHQVLGAIRDTEGDHDRRN